MNELTIENLLRGCLSARFVPQASLHNPEVHLPARTHIPHDLQQNVNSFLVLASQFRPTALFEVNERATRLHLFIHFCKSCCMSLTI